MKNKLAIVLTGAFIGLLASVAALANDAVPPRIHELIQSDETNVTISLAVVHGVGPFTIERDGPEGLETVVDDKIFSMAESLGTEPLCRGIEDIEYCEQVPDECLDCDGDGILECWDTTSWCETINYFEVIDWCVPEGQTEYSLFFTGEMPKEDADSIYVEPWDVVCESPETEADTDTDADFDADSGAEVYANADSDSADEIESDDGENTASAGCSISGVGASNDAGPGLVLLILLG